MAKTVAEIISYADEVLPNALTSSLKLTFLDEIFKTARRWTPDVIDWSTQTVADQQIYSLPNNINIHDIVRLHISNTTYNSTTVISSTLDWTKYKFGGYEDRYNGMVYYRATSEPASGERIGISPVPDDVVYLRAVHWNYPNTSNGSTTIIKNDFMIDYIQNKLLAKIAKTGVYPQIDIANNYELDAMEAITKLKLERKKIERELSDRVKSYKDWWC